MHASSLSKILDKIAQSNPINLLPHVTLQRPEQDLRILLPKQSYSVLDFEAEVQDIILIRDCRKF